MSMKRWTRSLLLAALLLLSACSSVPTPCHAPAVVVPPAWSTATAGSIAEPERWWKNFADPRLDALVEQALASNNDFAAAVIRVRRAQLQAGLVDTNRTPSVAAGASTQTTRSFDPVATSHASGVSAALSYELDLWGKLA